MKTGNVEFGKIGGPLPFLCPCLSCLCLFHFKVKACFWDNVVVCYLTVECDVTR